MTVTTGSISVPGVGRSVRHSINIVKQGIYEISSDQLAPLGQRLEVGDRVFHYAKAGAVTLAACKMCQAAATDAQFTKMAVAANASVGDMRIKVTLGSTAVTANQFAEGYVNIDNGGGGYTAYKIKDHLAITGNGTGYFNLFDPVQVALTTSMYASIVQNPWSATIVSPAAAAQTGMVVGVNPVAVTALYYYWSQTWGPASVLVGVAPAIGDPVMTSAATAGAVIVYSVTTSREQLGTMMRAETAADYGMVFLKIAA